MRGLEQRTEHSITDPDRLKAELEVIRDQGYAIDWNEQIVGLGMSAVPIRIGDRVIASFGIAVPTERLQNESYRETLLQELREMENTFTLSYQYGI